MVEGVEVLTAASGMSRRARYADLGLDVLQPEFPVRLGQQVTEHTKNAASMQKVGRVALNTEQVVTSLRLSPQLPYFNCLRQHRHPRVNQSRRDFSASKMIQDPFKPAQRVAGQRKDVWYE